jgi:hypothetical protein
MQRCKWVIAWLRQNRSANSALAIGEATVGLLHFSNGHERAMAVYAMNALAPPAGIEIVHQQRDRDQTEFHVTYRQGAAYQSIPFATGGSPWLLAGA